MQTLDIIDLIEKNPITKLSNTYNNKLLLKIKENFNEDEQKMFITSFYCYLNYHPKNDFVIDLDNVWKWLEFTNKANAKKLLLKYFTINIDYILLDASIKQNINQGGHNKETFLLTINSFKLFCIKANTEKATQIHKYYVKLEEILYEVIQEESNELKLKLQKQLEQKNNELQLLEEKKNKEYQDKLVNEKLLEKHKILLKEYANIGSIIYIIKVKTFENGKYIIKIGESRKGILNRFNEHKTKYEECLLLDCFMVQKSKDFESFLHNHEQIKGNRVNDLKGHEKELELFLVGKNLSYQILLNIIDNNIKYFNNSDVSKLELEIEQLKLMLELKETNNDHTVFQELITIVKNLSCKIDNLEKTNKLILENINKSSVKTTTNFNEPLQTFGPRLQKINPETFEIVKVYESVSECMKENYNMKRPSINKAIQQNKIYNGFRWLFVDRDLDPNIIYHIKETVELQKNQNIGYIAKLNKDKSEIINVYLDRKTASQDNGYLSTSALDIPVKNGTLKDGFYYMLYDDCSNKLKESFKVKNNNSPPLLYKNGLGQYDINNNLIREFICKYDCIRLLHISDKTLKKAMDKDKLYNNYYFRHIGSKIKCL
jgi:phage anti-repressor protein